MKNTIFLAVIPLHIKIGCPLFYVLFYLEKPMTLFFTTFYSKCLVIFFIISLFLHLFSLFILFVAYFENILISL